MPIKLNHTIVHSNDPQASADFLTSLFGLPPAKRFGPFHVVEVGNEVSLDFLSGDGMDIQMQHYAFLVSEPEFDAIFGRIRERRLKYWADPGQKQRGRDQSSLRRPGRLLPGPERASPRDHHPSLRQRLSRSFIFDWTSHGPIFYAAPHGAA